jgi:hypothetical protein
MADSTFATAVSPWRHISWESLANPEVCTWRSAIQQRRSLDQLEHQRAGAARFLDAVDRGDVRVVERRQRLRLALEPREPLGVGRERVREDLQRHLAPEPRVVDPIDLPRRPG